MMTNNFLRIESNIIRYIQKKVDANLYAAGYCGHNNNNNNTTLKWIQEINIEESYRARQKNIYYNTINKKEKENVITTD